MSHGDHDGSVVEKELVCLPGGRCFSYPVLPPINKVFVDDFQVNNVKVDVPGGLAMPVTNGSEQA